MRTAGFDSLFIEMAQAAGRERASAIRAMYPR